MKKTSTIKLESVKSSDGWVRLVYELKYDRFKEENKDLDEDELNDKFYTEVISKNFEWGEFANLEIEFDEDFNIVGGRIKR